MTFRDEMRMSDVLAAYFSVPILLSSIYGMNIPLPFQNERYAFVLYIAACVLWCVFVTYVAYRR